MLDLQQGAWLQEVAVDLPTAMHASSICFSPSSDLVAAVLVSQATGACEVAVFGVSTAFACISHSRGQMCGSVWLPGAPYLVLLSHTSLARLDLDPLPPAAELPVQRTAVCLPWMGPCMAVASSGTALWLAHLAHGSDSTSPEKFIDVDLRSCADFSWIRGWTLDQVECARVTSVHACSCALAVCCSPRLCMVLGLSDPHTLARYSFETELTQVSFSPADGRWLLGIGVSGIEVLDTSTGSCIFRSWPADLCGECQQSVFAVEPCAVGWAHESRQLQVISLVSSPSATGYSSPDVVFRVLSF